MTLLEILQSTKYQELFLKHFVLDNGKFIENTAKSKKDFLYFQDDDVSLLHDTIITDGYAFFESDQGLYLVFEDVVLYCNSEADLIPLGDNAINFTTTFKDTENFLDIIKAIDYVGFTNSVQIFFGKMNPIPNQSKLEKLSQKFLLNQ